MLKDIGLELFLLVNHHHDVLIVIVALEARHAGRFSSVFSILPKLMRQRCYSKASTQRAPAFLAQRTGDKGVRVPRLVNWCAGYWHSASAPVPSFVLGAPLGN